VPCGGFLLEIADEATLPDAGIAAEQQDSPVPFDGAIEPFEKGAKGRFPTYRRRTDDRADHE
jgi:hypothetical protein